MRRDGDPIFRIPSAVRRVAKNEAQVDAVALVGSHSRETARLDSDVDLIVLTADPTIYLANAAWVETFGTGRRVEREDDGAVQSLRVVYADGFEVEFGLTSVQWAATNPVDAGTAGVIRAVAVVLVDKHQRLEALTRAVVSASVTIRDFEDGDSIQALTDLLHRAYRRLLNMGLRYWASRGSNADG